jgi:hypothetical protein
MQDFEKLGVFYLGKAAGTDDELLLYDSRDLTTHAVCVGMTGSGKTGLCIALLEEAAIDKIPAIVVDPKGDMANLLLSFPDLNDEDFLPWVSADEASRKGLSREEFAAAEAKRWREGIASFGQSGERIRKMREATNFCLYTPGSQSGSPLSILHMLDLPGQGVLEDAESFSDYVGGTAGSLLGLLGIEADPINSKEHILVSTILQDQWLKGKSLTIADLIEAIQKPPVSQIGVMNIESFYPEKERFALALRFNNLLASPQFSAWMEGEPLDIDRLLYDEGGKPKLSILSIAHLSDPERMFFVALLLNRLLGWVRTQPGTSSLRALFYMDEIFGYFPPVSNPPSKTPLLTLLKQARAYGLGIMLTTQNPADLDYKGLANAGTWFIGRLQTERDKARLLDGLESAGTGGSFNRAELDAKLSSLKARTFLMNNVHNTEPILFDTRFCLSYLAGPLTREQIRELCRGQKEVPTAGLFVPEGVDSQNPIPAVAPLPAGGQANVTELVPDTEPAPAIVPAGTEGYVTVAAPPPGDIPAYFLSSRAVHPVYRPGLFGLVNVHFADAKNGVFESRDECYTTLIGDEIVAVDWAKSFKDEIRSEHLIPAADVPGRFALLPAAAGKRTSYTAWTKDLTDYVFRNSVLELYENRALKVLSRPGETERDFAIRLGIMTREKRAADLDALRIKYEKARQTLEERLRKAGQAVEREKEQAKDSKLQTMISIGSTIFGSFLGKKALSASTLGRATTAAKSASRAARQEGDVARAKESLETLNMRIEELEQQFEADSQEINNKYDSHTEAIEPFALKPLKRDIKVRALAIVWLPYEEGADGTLKEAW